MFNKYTCNPLIAWKKQQLLRVFSLCQSSRNTLSASHQVVSEHWGHLQRGSVIAHCLRVSSPAKEGKIKKKKGQQERKQKKEFTFSARQTTPFSVSQKRVSLQCGGNRKMRKERHDNCGWRRWVTVCCRLYLLMPDDEEQKGFPPNREFRCSWDDVLVSTVTGFCSGIWATWNLSVEKEILFDHCYIHITWQSWCF